MPLNVPPYADGAIYLTPQGLLFACGFGCVALGNARAAIDWTEEFASDKRPRFGSRPLSQDPVVQQAVGKAEAIWRGAKALCITRCGFGDAIRERGSITLEERVELRMAGTHAIRESARAVDICYNLSGSSSIFADRAIQRRFQDAHVITQQVQGARGALRDGGAVLCRGGASGRDLTPSVPPLLVLLVSLFLHRFRFGEDGKNLGVLFRFVLHRLLLRGDV